jgi:hypothetical protein
VKGAFREWWTDTSMAWDPKEYGGVTSVLFPTDPETDGHSWVPDIVIREDAGSGFFSNTKYTNLMLYSNGTSYNEIIGDFVVTFNAIVDYYPFDN